MSTRWYPIYQKGNPQLRIFLPNFWMKLVKPKHSQPPNMVKFLVSLQMTNHDVKNYLEKIYEVPVVDVRTEIHSGDTRKELLRGYVIKDDDYKIAYVTLPKDQHFEFPNLFPEDKKEDEKRDQRVMDEAKKMHQKSAQKNVHRAGLPSWFSI